MFFIPILMLAAGLYLGKRKKEIDNTFTLHELRFLNGYYKSKRALSSWSAWEYAQMFVRRMFLTLAAGEGVFSFVLLIVMLAKLIDDGGMDTVLLSYFVVQIGIIFIIRPITEARLRQFNDGV